jgi:prepilin-type processing-associated H-X9-DG protein
MIVVGLYALCYLPWRKFQINNLPPCYSNQKQIALGIFMYSQDYGGKLPSAIFPGKIVGWANGLQPYVKSTQIFQCPQENNWPQRVPQANEPGFTDYWFNRNIAGLQDKKLKNVDHLIMLGDGDGGSPESTASYAIQQIPLSWQQSPNSPIKRHLDGANYAFADGHVKWLKPDEILRAQSSYTFVNK